VIASEQELLRGDEMLAVSVEGLQPREYGNYYQSRHHVQICSVRNQFSLRHTASYVVSSSSASTRKSSSILARRRSALCLPAL
jgi:hypothetical protein